MSDDYYVHPSSYIDEPTIIGAGTKIWHFCHIMAHAQIGQKCNIGQNVVVSSHVIIGNGVKIQNNVSIYQGTIIEDDVFLGPACVLTNISNPRSQVLRKHLYETTLIRRGATIGANATIVCGTEIGRYAFIAAGSVVTKDVPDYALMLGNPAHQRGWMSRLGHPLKPNDEGLAVCPESGMHYLVVDGQMTCRDLDENSPLPAEFSSGQISYQNFKKEPSS